MLQNPSKYHPNPLSHFLSFHSSSHQQQPNQNAQKNFTHLHQTTITENISTKNEIASLDVGKSFTIAAILGLQKTHATDKNQKDYNSVMNLSLHNANQKSNLMPNFNNGININNYDCDRVNNSVVNKYLPAVSLHANLSGSHVRLGHFEHHAAISAAAAAAAVVSGNSGPNALQSLQQLHQQHKQQTSLSYASREKHKNEHYSNKKSALKSKRVRTIFTPEQLERLESEFERQQYMVGPERLYLAHTLQLTEAQVKVWFQNRRIKWRKHHLEITQQRLALIRHQQIPQDERITNTGLDLEQPCNRLSQSESDVSVCNDSIDGESIIDGEES